MEAGMTTDELHVEMIHRFEKVDARFEGVDARFATMDARFASIDARFAKVDAEFANMRAEMNHRFDELRAEMNTRFGRVDAEFAKLRVEIKTENEMTRRHFEVWAEKMNDSVKIVAEATAHQTMRIDDHEKRLKRLERPRRS